MDEELFKQSVVPALKRAAAVLQDIQQRRGGTRVIAYIECDNPLYLQQAYAFHRVVRRLPPGSEVDLLLESLGGSIDAACTVTSICKSRFQRVAVLVPFMAKSAATLIALMADELVMAGSAQLGPVDPLIRHPATDMWIAAHSIRDALDFVESAKDPYVKLTLADKLDPLLIGAF